MSEEGLVACTEVIESRFPVGGSEDTVLRAATIADEAHFAVAALLGKCVAFVLSELSLRL